MHWTYKLKSEFDLEQGDILQPTEYLTKNVLDEYHPYYSKHPDNKLYIVLTQSCDLVRRSGECKSDYITLAPVRPLSVIIKREFSQHLLNNSDPNAQPYGSNRVRGSFEDFLRKLFNNNDPHYFFIRKQEDMHIAQDMCAITSLSISIKSEHYSECLKARILQLEDVFQAKLGWLVGQKYSRVGTPDWDESQLNKEVEQVLSGEAVWIDDDQISKVNKAVREKSANQEVVGTEQLQQILSGFTPKKQQAIDAIFNVLISQKLLPQERDPLKHVLRKKLLSDPDFSQFF